MSRSLGLLCMAGALQVSFPVEWAEQSAEPAVGALLGQWRVLQDPKSSREQLRVLAADLDVRRRGAGSVEKTKKTLCSVSVPNVESLGL